MSPNEYFDVCYRKTQAEDFDGAAFWVSEVFNR